MTGDYTAAAMTGEESTIDILCGCSAVSAKEVYWVLHKESYLMQWWRDKEKQVHCKFFSGKNIIKTQKKKEGEIVRIVEGEIK